MDKPITQDRYLKMAQYAIAFDIDTKRMKDDGLSDSQRTKIYQTEIPNALASVGFTAHPQGSLYHTESEKDPITALMQIQGVLKQDASNFCKYAKRVHIFRMEEWSDATTLISDHVSDGPPTAEEEIEEQEELDMAGS
jgi:virulence-associated protein VapD